MTDTPTKSAEAIAGILRHDFGLLTGVEREAVLATARQIHEHHVAPALAALAKEQEQHAVTTEALRKTCETWARVEAVSRTRAEELEAAWTVRADRLQSQREELRRQRDALRLPPPEHEHPWRDDERGDSNWGRTCMDCGRAIRAGGRMVHDCPVKTAEAPSVCGGVADDSPACADGGSWAAAPLPEGGEGAEILDKATGAVWPWADDPTRPGWHDVTRTDTRTLYMPGYEGRDWRWVTRPRDGLRALPALVEEW